MTKRYTVEIFRNEEHGGFQRLDLAGLAFARTYAKDAHDELGCAVTLTDNQTGETLYRADESECREAA